MPSTRNPISIRTAKDGEFVTASLRASNPMQPGKGVSSRGSRFAIVNYTLKDFIEYAWVIHPKQIDGGPDWLDKENFDMGAILPSPRPKSDQMRRMTQTVVTNSFLLKFHFEKRDMPVYTLVPANGGLKMKARKPEDSAGAVSSIGLPFAPHIPARNVTIPRLAALLQGTVLDRPVIDRTGLTGTYDFDLQWQSNEHEFGGRGGKGTWHGNTKDPDLFTAIQAQLGLKLQAETLPVDVMKIDAATKPVVMGRSVR